LRKSSQGFPATKASVVSQGISMIKQTKALADRRREKRFQVRSGALVKYNRHATKLGQTLDISVGGLAFNYVARRKLP
jgi:hypothetical protein